MTSILVTGASGFIGSFVVEEALRRGMDTWAAVRPTSSRRYIRDPRIHFIELDLSSEERLTEQLRGHNFDYVVHAAGATKCLCRDDFFTTNTDGTRHLATALMKLCMPLRRFVFISSLSVFGATHEQQPYADITEHDTPRPNTAYGQSKLRAEQWLDSIGTDFPYIVLRPTGVYGPRERDYFLMAQSIARHIDFAAGYRRQDITFVYVEDVVQAVFLALDHGVSRRKYFLTDGGVYSSTDFSDLIRHALGNPWMLRLKVPLWVLRAVTAAGERWAHVTGRITALNNDKYNILSQRNWRCDIEPAMNELGYHPHFDLKRGVDITVAWYRDNGWL
ncbi:MAG: NAD(P)-dependent oxidoreductase [Prevotella sp.]|nr:NAD(P)-dependent oxidoreductase [Prevotella sp.]